MTPAFEKWLREHVTDADRRAALADAADGLVDLYNAERIDLEDVLTVSEWPAFARNRFIRAWQALRSAGRAAALAADEGTALRPTVETRATQTPDVIMAPAPNAAPRLAARLPGASMDTGEHKESDTDAAPAPAPPAPPAAPFQPPPPPAAAPGPGRKSCPVCGVSVGNAANKCPKCKYDYKAARLAFDAGQAFANSQTPEDPALSVGPSLGPRDARGCFPCPAGCPRTFSHAPAAVQHGRSCAAGGAQAQRMCTTCKATYTSGHFFCPKCGIRLVAVALVTARPSTEASGDNDANDEPTQAAIRADRDDAAAAEDAAPPPPPADTSGDEAAAPSPPPPPPDTSRDEELARQLAGLPGRARQATQRFSSLEDAGHSYASPKRAADPRRPKATKRPKKAKSPVAASAESSDAAEARALATDQAAIREAYAREQARATEEAREQARATEEDILRIGNAALTRRLSTEEEIPRGREKKRCAATRAPAETPLTAPRSGDTTDDDSDAEVLPAKRVRGTTPPRPTLQSPTATTASDTVPVTPEVPKKVKVPSKPWDLEETRRFYDALRRFGTDFTMMLTAFPGRTQRQLKNKYKQESRTQSSLVSMALDASIATDLTAPQVAPDDDNMSTGNVNDDEAEFFTCSF
jgi:hypothetical protein